MQRLSRHAILALVPPDQPTEYLCVDYDLKYRAAKTPPEICRKGQGGNKVKPRDKGTAVKVIDICCGRGGDLNKLMREFVLDLYVGVDISYDELNEVREY